MWTKIEDWAATRGALEDLLLLLDATVAIERPGAIGSILHFLARPHVVETLAAWSDENAYAALASNIAAPLSLTPEILLTYRPLPDAKPARSRFTGSLEKLYIYALLATRNPYPAADLPNRLRYDRLRLWTLVHAMERAAQDVLTDVALYEVATKFRLAGDGERVWLAALEGLPPRGQSFDSLDQQISLYAKNRLVNHPKLPQNERLFLRALRSVADHELNPDERSTLHRLSERTLRYSHRAASSPPACPLSQAGEDSTRSTATVIAELDDQALVEIDVPPEGTLAQQIRHGSSVLLASVEENQFLPWSWSRPMPGELKRIEGWTHQVVGGTDPNAQLLGAAVWIATRTGRSLRRTLEMPVGDTPQEEWTVSPVHLARIPARREGGWIPALQSEHWIRPLASQHVIRLPSAIAAVIQAWIDRKPGTSSMGAFVEPQVLLRRFAEAMNAVAPRITHGMLTNVLPQQLYRAGGDGILARLFSRHPQSGLPGAAAYPSWTGHDLMEVLATAGLPELGDNQSDHNALGSRLDPIESLLRTEIRLAGIRTLRRRRQGIVAFHNGLTSYLTVALHAATGVRAVRAAFESLSDFDLEQRFVFISDKASGSSRDGRLVPVPESLCDYLIEHYLPYLRSLGQWVSAAGDPVLGREISRAATPGERSALPLLFSLACNENVLYWQPISERAVANEQLFRWPLPLRHFRHRLATTLRRLLVDPEIIDGLLGHAERGSASYGDRSPRVWLDDMASVRPVLESCFADLEFLPLRLLPSPDISSLGRLRPSEPGIQGPATFGRAERAIQRQERLRTAILSAQDIIDSVCAGKDIVELTAEEIDGLGQRLLFNANGLPHSLGTLRYGLLLRRLERAQRRHDRTLRVKRLYLAFDNERSPFTLEAVGALETYSRLLGLLKGVPEPANCRRALRRALAHGTARLVLESRFCDPEALRCILAGINFRIIGMHLHHYIEYGPDVQSGKPDALCRRIEISHTTARLLAEATHAKNSINAGPHRIDEALAPLTDVLLKHRQELRAIDSMAELVTALAVLINQVNAITRPGIVAGYLAGRVESYSLTWYDFTRLQDGLARSFADVSPNSDAPDGSLSLSESIRLKGVPSAVTPDTRQQLGRRLIADVRKELSTPPGSGKRFGNEKRTEIARRIRTLASDAEGKAGPATCALTHWVCELLTRHKRGGGYLALSAVVRYLSALSRPIIELVDDVALDELDEDEITEVYTSLVQSIRPLSQHYSRCRLQEFHNWLSLQIPMEAPDWSEIPGAESVISASPAIFSENEYQLALHQLLGADGEAGSQAALLLMLCYRFGLRSGEALGLLREDWQWDGGRPVLLVRGNWLRRLKTRTTSQRLAPLLEALTSAEHHLVDSQLARLEARDGDRTDTPVFGAIALDRNARAGLRKRVIATLRAATGNPHITLHHARHSLANRLAASLFGVSVPRLDGGTFGVEPVRSVLLGSDRVTRRLLPVLERYLGHGDSGTTHIYYLHLLDYWSCQLTDIARDTVSPPIPGVTYLDELPSYCPVVRSSRWSPKAHARSPAKALMHLRLRARGHGRLAAASRLDLDENLAAVLEERLGAVASRFRFSASERAHVPEELADSVALAHLLTRTSDSAWAELIAYAEQRSRDVPHLPPPIAVDTLVGTSRQIVMWDDEQFAGIRRQLDWWGIAGEQLLVVHTPPCDEAVLRAARQHGFDPIPSGTATPRIQIDPMHTGTRQELRVEQRVALLIRETAHPIRHAAEFCMAMVILDVTSNPATSNES